MGLKAIVENLDDVPEAQRDLYTEKDGKFYLDLEEDIRNHPSVTALSNALSKQKDAVKDLKAKLADIEQRLKSIPDDFDAEEYKRLKEAAENDDDPPDDPEGKKKKREDAQRLHEQRIQRMKEEHATELQKVKDELAAAIAKTRKLVVDTAIEDALNEQNIKPEFRKATRSLLREKVKVVEDEDGNDVAIVETDLNPEMPLKDYAAEWAGSDEGRHFVGKPSGSDAENKGGGNKGEKNPWTKEHWNLTEQGKLVKNDRAKAERLAAAAGRPLKG
jgi:hypothetical protein